MRRTAAGGGRTVKPTASATIEPTAATVMDVAGHAVRLLLRFANTGPQFVDRAWVVALARSALSGFPSLSGQESPTFTDVLTKTGDEAVGVAVSVFCAGQPVPAAIARLRQTICAAGYDVMLHELRECSEAGCTTTTVIDWGRPPEVPGSWYNAHTCGRHGYKACAACSSTYVMSSQNAIRAAPSVHCEVCGGILIEWGGSKVWTAELVTRCDRPRP